MNKFFSLHTILIAIIFFSSCKKDKTDTDTDEALYNEVKASGYTYYQGGNILAGAPASPHGNFKLRFNSVAQTVLDSTGELPAGVSFPTGSMIVKEVYDGSSLHLFAVMKKDPSNTNAAGGWLWAELNTDGSTNFSTGKKGDGCISCHSNSPNRDLTRTFDLH
jgi:hypothetical protein